MNIYIRNITRDYGGNNPGSGYVGATVNILINGIFHYAKTGTTQCVGDGDFYANPTSIVAHEISHSLFGGNNFHASGGNHRYPSCPMVFLNLQGGYGLMGSTGSGLVGCNGYERWRMHWKHPQSVDYIAARNANNSQSVVSDISMADGPQSFLLRDFVTYGDVVRIKLPYKDGSSSSNQYIWLENHQVGMNNKLDYLEYFNMYLCRPQGLPGIYAYYQVGRDILTSDQGNVWDNFHRDNLKTIPAEGYYDYDWVEDTYRMNCVAYGEVSYAIRRGDNNPFCGGQDQEYHFFPNEEDTILKVTHEYSMWRKVIGNDSIDNLPSIGDNLDAFSSHTKINMGTNPSTCNTRTFHSGNTSYTSSIYGYNSELNTRKTYLSGLGIEMIPLGMNYLVHIRWDDFDIKDDARWTGDVVLKDTAILTTGKTVTLAQNRTVAQNTRDSKTGLFDKSTLLTCEEGSYFQQNSGSQMLLTEGSSLVLDSGSTYVLQDSASMLVQEGCSLIVRKGADFQVLGDAIVTIDSCGTAILSNTAILGASARIIIKPGGKLVVDGGTLTSAYAGEMWQGIYLEGHRTQHQTAANQGTVQLLNGAVIENARRGIYTGAFGENWHTTGGIITADSATFRNCAKAVEYLSYADTTAPGFVNDNWGSFSNCTFTVDDNNLFAANNTDFLAHVTMWDVKGVRFTHCRFEDVRTGFHTRKSAISTIDAGFKVRTGCDYTVPNPDCNCYLTTNTYCSFTGFNTAINATTSGKPYAVIIDGARFSNNMAGVKIEGNTHVEVTRCTFDLNVQTGLAFKPAVGLFLDTCTGYLVEENTFSCSATAPQYQRYGILVGNSGPDANSIYRNDISNMSVGVYVQGDNAKKLTGLQFTCNVFSGNENDIYVETNATIGVNQGSPSKGADNTFSPRATSNLYNGGTGVVNYYYSTGSGHAPSHTTNVNLYGTAGSNMCGSTICGYNPGNPGGGPKSPTPGFLALKQQYENLFADFDRNGFANLLTATIPPQAEPPTLSDELVAAQYAAQQINVIATELYAQSHTAIRALMADTLEDVRAIWEWLNATPGLASRYLAVEAGFVAGADAVEAHGRASLQDIATHLTTAAERDEYDNYVAFHALKEALEYGNGHVAWPRATDAQVGELVRIADANTGRSSLLAKNVLCFFFGICYDDDMETRALATTTAIPPQAEPPALTESRIMADPTTLTGQQNVIVHPNPTDNVLHVSVTDGEIARIEMFDAFGRIVPVETHGRASLPSPTTTVTTSDIPSGVYVLRVTLTDGTMRTVKVVKK
ncbi:MAG: T9SS type A sorting domain-containing protein [Bacteroidales bacterium]|nr:T9SS type A sorting domain-containing protein [Bacteroidales bacterium]